MDVFVVTIMTRITHITGVTTHIRCWTWTFLWLHASGFVRETALRASPPLAPQHQPGVCVCVSAMRRSVTDGNKS